MVLADGSIIHATPDNVNKEAYFCVLGGFPGSFGIVVNYTIKCVPDSDMPHFRVIDRTWPLAALHPEQLYRIVQHAQSINTQQEIRGTRDFQVRMSFGTSYPKVDLLPTIPLFGHISEYIDVQLGTDMSAAQVQFTMMWYGIDTGRFDSYQYDTLLKPLDAIATCTWPAVNIPLPASIGTNVASSFKLPADHRYVIAGNYSTDWLSCDDIQRLCGEFRSRAESGLVYYSQLFLFPSSSAWHRNKGKNALGWRDARVVCDDWVFFPSSRPDQAALVSQQKLHDDLAWYQVQTYDSRPS